MDKTEALTLARKIREDAFAFHWHTDYTPRTDGQVPWLVRTEPPYVLGTRNGAVRVAAYTWQEAVTKFFRVSCERTIRGL
jgi:hypothetical protein